MRSEPNGGESDLAASVEARPDAVLVPKVSSLDDLRRVSASARGVSLWAMIETPRAILDIAQIAGAGGNLVCLVLGTND